MVMIMLRDISLKMRITTIKRTSYTKGTMKENITKENMRKGITKKYDKINI